MSSEVKDPFQILADELTLVRRDLDKQLIQFNELKQVNALTIESMVTNTKFQALIESHESWSKQFSQSLRDIKIIKTELSSQIKNFNWHVSSTAKTTIENYTNQTITSLSEVTKRRQEEFEEKMTRSIKVAVEQLERKSHGFLDAVNSYYWRHKLGIKGVIIASFLTGFVINSILNAYMWGHHSAQSFGNFPSMFCETANGERMITNDKSEACIFWLSGPAYESKKQAIRDANAKK